MLKSLLLIIFAVFTQSAFCYDMPSSFIRIHHAETRFQHRNVFAASRPSNEALKTRLLAQYEAWKGTRYHMGGSSHRGVDCSALMQHLFSESMALSLPRTTSEQLQRGKAVSRGELKPGDLVFFRTGRARRHVGVFIGGDEFIHASTSQGVTISSLSNDYWRAHYQTARRVAVKMPG